MTTYDSGLLSLATADFNRDHNITYSDMAGLFNLAATESPTLTDSQLLTLNALIANPAATGMAQSTITAAQKVMVGISADTPSSTLLAFVNQYFPPLNSLAGLPATPYPYTTFTGMLYANSTPSNMDVAQGNLADCFLLSSLAATALHAPAMIESMIVPNTDGTWTVRFYNPTGQTFAPQTFIVNNMLPTIGGGNTAYAHVLKGVLWPAFIEKAYAQYSSVQEYNTAGQLITISDTYLNLNGNFGCSCFQALKQITGNSAIRIYTPDTANFSVIMAGIAAGSIVTFETSPIPAQGIVPNHAYYLVSYNQATGLYTLGNPYGPNNGWVTLTWSQIEASFFMVTVCPLTN